MRVPSASVLQHADPDAAVLCFSTCVSSTNASVPAFHIHVCTDAALGSGTRLWELKDWIDRTWMAGPSPTLSLAPPPPPPPHPFLLIIPDLLPICSTHSVASTRIPLLRVRDAQIPAGSWHRASSAVNSSGCINTSTHPFTCVIASRPLNFNSFASVKL